MHTARAYGDWLEVDYRVRRWRTQRESLISELETGIIMTHLNLPQQKAAGVSHRRQPDPCREIRQLCQHMMDYLSAGHFALYTLLLHEGAQLTRRAHHLISTIYHRIEHSTDEAICFNDKYDADEASVLGEPSLADDVARLSLSMRQRFDLEDQLVTLLHDCQEPAEPAATRFNPVLSGLQTQQQPPLPAPDS